MEDITFAPTYKKMRTLIKMTSQITEARFLIYATFWLDDLKSPDVTVYVGPQTWGSEYRSPFLDGQEVGTSWI